MPDHRRLLLGKSRRSLLRLAPAALAFVIAPGAHGETGVKAGSVEEVKGEAFAEKDRVKRNLEREAPLFIHDQVGTGAASRLAVRLGRNTILRLGEKAQVTIDRYLVEAGGEINLQSGPILFDRPASAPKSSLQIRSPFGLIAVRGTRFFAGPSNDVFGVFVERGSVAVTAAGKRVVVRAGEGTNIARPGAAPTAATRWGDARIRAALASVS